MKNNQKMISHMDLQLCSLCKMCCGFCETRNTVASSDNDVIIRNVKQFAIVLKSENKPVMFDRIFPPKDNCST